MYLLIQFPVSPHPTGGCYNNKRQSTERSCVFKAVSLRLPIAAIVGVVVKPFLA